VRARHVAVLLAAALVTGACGGDLPRDDDGLVEVDAIAVDVPDGWDRTDEDPQPPIVTNSRFVDPDERLRLLQVIVGCDERGVDALVDAVGQPRGAFVVTGAFEATSEPDVAGLDRARRVTLELEPGAGDGDDAVIEAVYGETGDAVVLVELTLPTGSDGPDPDALLASLRADGDALGAACHEDG
jgi:hypothetical protein